MAKFQVWDIPSASLIDETDDFHEIARTVQALVDADGPGVLDDLSLSEARDETGQYESYRGSDIMRCLNKHLATGSATVSA
ncbi:MAG: hypothetical protein H0V37_02640 [Chloroflexia bacterium]|nr:hypothetical protein [Chloroflexia bacterium]